MWCYYVLLFLLRYGEVSFFTVLALLTKNILVPVPPVVSSKKQGRQQIKNSSLPGTIVLVPSYLGVA